MEPVEATDPAALGGYPLLARLGAEGMGQVYLSRTPAGWPLALKVVRTDLTSKPDFEARFAREIRNRALVRSPFTVCVADDSPPGSRLQWLAIEYVGAPSLAEWVAAHGPLPPAGVRALAGELAAALAAVHACSLAHRDAKPNGLCSSTSVSPGRPTTRGTPAAAASSVLGSRHPHRRLPAPPPHRPWRRPPLRPWRIAALPVCSGGPAARPERARSRERAARGHGYRAVQVTRVAPPMDRRGCRRCHRRGPGRVPAPVRRW
ncbi:hypothetical protein ABZ079_29225 [Streptomyces sp. NPDC006314]|uniref:protein kinase domain-containing protein n=1 Tax=Streptomyces sp. NPDC006314 TaxID=3154475 RepID=UPI0033B56122